MYILYHLLIGPSTDVDLLCTVLFRLITRFKPLLKILQSDLSLVLILYYKLILRASGSIFARYSSSQRPYS